MLNYLKLEYTLNLWDSLLSLVGIVVGAVIAVYLHRLSKRLSVKDKFEHEQAITKQVRGLKLYESVVLADVEKYTPFNTDLTNKTYRKQGAELYTIIPNVGLQFMLYPVSSDEGIPVGIIPFEWIEYIRDHDGEDNKTIVVCKFRGEKLYKNFKSPFKRIGSVYKNKSYKESIDPDFLRYTTLKP